MIGICRTIERKVTRVKEIVVSVILSHSRGFVFDAASKRRNDRHVILPIEKILVLFSDEENSRKSVRIFNLKSASQRELILEEFENPNGFPRVFHVRK